MSQEIDQPRVTDLTPEEQKAVAAFKEEGMPGLDRVDETTLRSILDLYLDGKTYFQISRITRTPKVLVMYLAERFNWPTTRNEQLNEMEHLLYQRTMQARTASQDFLLSLQHAFQKRIGKKIELYLRTNDEQHMDGVNLKEVDKLLKTIDHIDRLVTEKLPQRPKAPLVSINPGDGVTLKQAADGSVEITPKENSMSNKLRQMADERRLADAARADQLPKKEKKE